MEVFRRSATVFIDNLPQGIWKVWLFNLLSRFGRIQSIFSPNKKSRTTGKTFCFVRFVSPHHAQSAVNFVNGRWIWGDFIVANIARFGVTNKFQRVTTEENGQASNKVNGRGQNQQRDGRPSNARKPIEQSRSRAQEWRKKGIQTTQKENKQSNTLWIKKQLPIKVKELGNGWLYRSAIAKLSSARSVVRIQDQLRSLGHAHVMVRHMGGDMVVLTFKDTEERDTMFNEGRMAWLTEWFEELHKWEDTKSNPCSHLVWLNCYGIPLQLSLQQN